MRGSDIVVMGNDAQRFAEVFHVETRRPMHNGTLNPQEPHSLTVVRSIISKLVGKATGEKQKILFSVPASCRTATSEFPTIRRLSSRCSKELGYDATPIAEGLAVIFGELGDSNFTGIGSPAGAASATSAWLFCRFR